MNFDCGDVQYIKVSFIKGISLNGVIFPTAYMVHIALISYWVIIKVCECDECQQCFSQRDFTVELSQSVLETEDFPFLSLGMCKSNHDPQKIVNMACWICSNILLINYCFRG